MDGISLFELNAQVRRCLADRMPDAYWVYAETMDVRVQGTGHCYLEFIQKDPRGNNPIAKARGVIWSNIFRILKPYFESSTGQSFGSGIKVLVQVSVEFHELYGYSLSVRDIDPSYTLGDMMRRRMEILKQLEADGILTMNKELPMPVLPQRIAIISSPSAAGYGDFSNQLATNTKGYYFHVELFAAVMQGHQTENSVLHALELILARADEFDVVVIIRGGGATSDLSAFDTYLLAAACAQFPLPVITGIGHERDDTVLDTVAHTRVKTPTAAAEFLIACMDEAAGELFLLSSRLRETVMRRLTDEKHRMETLKSRIPVVALQRFNEASMQLLSVKGRLNEALNSRIVREKHALSLLKQRVVDASPEKLLKRGYSITLKDGKAVTCAAQLCEGDQLLTRLADGEVNSRVIKK
jgi:exodeoxyribonuclease VII large subunit